MIYLNQPYRCTHCGKIFVVIHGAKLFNSFLPVDVITGKEIYDTEFDKMKHSSHLLNCPQLQARWESVKKKIQKDIDEKEKVEMKSLLK